MKKTILIPAFMIALMGFALLGSVQPTHAFFGSEMATSFFGQLATKLGLSTEAVETAVTELRAEHKAERATEVVARLNAAVAAGTITEAQKQAILDHHEEMKEEHEDRWEEMRGLTKEERKAEHEEHREEAEAWAVEQGIDLTTLHELLGGEGRRGGMHRGGPHK